MIAEDIPWRCDQDGHPVALRSYKQEVAGLREPPWTADRWLVIVRWQCLWVEDHHGEVSYTTDDPDHSMPWSNPAAPPVPGEPQGEKT